MDSAVIIAGGEGSRLYPLTVDRPKAMVEVGGKPLIYWVINWLKGNGIKHIVIGVAYKKENLYKYLEENSNFGLDVDFSEHTIQGGTAEAFRLAISRYIEDRTFIAMNSDELTNMELSDMIDTHMKFNPIATISTAPFHCRFSVVESNAGKIIDFKYGKKLMNIQVSNGIYIFDKKILEHMPTAGSIEDDVFKVLSKEGKIASYKMPEDKEWISVNSIKDIKDAEQKLREWNFI
jgi:NDP-sugar pyrophosphorylase family protein